MNYITYYKEENEAVKERYNLVMGRVLEIAEGEDTVPERFREYFKKQAEKLVLIKKLYDMSERGEYRNKTEEELKAINDMLHKEVRDNYEKMVIALDCDLTQTQDGIKIVKALDFLSKC